MGSAPTYIAPKFNCPICHGVGWVYHDELLNKGDNINRDFGKAFPCQCRKIESEERHRLALLSFCDLPAGSEGMTFETFTIDHEGFNKAKLEEALNAALDFLSGNLSFYTLMGPVNCGKTHLSVACCREYMSAGIPAKYAFTPNLLDDLRNSYNKDAEFGYQKLLRRYCEVPLLVLDDLYRQRTTPWGSEKLMQIIHTRYQARLATIFTTNKTFEEIMELDVDQGEAIVSRLQREFWCRVVSIS